MEVSIIIVNWNTCDYLYKCLNAVYNTIDEIIFEVVLVDNASTDGSVGMVKELFPDVHLIENNENLGFGQANNKAILKCDGKYVLFLNSDAFLSDGTLQKMMNVMELNNTVGIVGANLKYPDGSPQSSYGRLPTLMSEIAVLFGLDRIWKLIRRSNAINYPMEVGYVEGASLMARREMLNQIGFFDEYFYFFNEEIDLCYRAKAAGWKVVVHPPAHVIHVGGGSTGETPERIVALFRGKSQYINKYQGKSSKHIYIAAIWITTLLKIVVFSVLRVVTMGRVKRDRLWFDVYKDLGEV
jgi:GT2 family glycosyltransferase